MRKWLEFRRVVFRSNEIFFEIHLNKKKKERKEKKKKKKNSASHFTLSNSCKILRQIPKFENYSPKVIMAIGKDRQDVFALD